MSEAVVDFSGFYEERYEIRDNPCPEGVCHEDYCLTTEVVQHGWVTCVRVRKGTSDFNFRCDECFSKAEYVSRVFGSKEAIGIFCSKHIEKYVQNMTKVLN